MTTVSVVAVSIDTQNVVLYLENGDAMVIPQGDPRVTRAYAEAKAGLTADPTKPVQVYVGEPGVSRQQFADAEKGTGGLVKFFRIAKAHIKGWFEEESPDKLEVAPYIPPTSFGVIPGSKPDKESESVKPVAEDKPADFPEVVEKTNDEKLAEANARLDVLTGKGSKTSDPAFHTAMDPKTETIVAVVGNKIIPGAENLSNQLTSASKLQDYTGFKVFMERLAKVIDQRQHSVEDLLKFLGLADLPIADDGCIVMYKRLERRSSGTYVDVHSRKVQQKVGSLVFMDQALVDPNRRRDCSNGLHVATVGYLHSFSGDVTIIGKVRPEDVIAVPERDANKMRVSGYHIIAELTPAQRSAVNNGRKLSSVEGGVELLNAVLRGNHIGITQHVEIKGHGGSNVIITDVSTTEETSRPISTGVINTNLDLVSINKSAPVEPVKPSDLKPGLTVVDSEGNVGTYNPDRNKTKSVAKAETVKKETIPEVAQRLWAEYQSAPSAERLEVLVAFKKESKRSWAKLGISDNAAELIEVEFIKLPTKVPTKTVGDFSELDTPAKASSPRARIKAVFDAGKLTAESAEEILRIKKAAKKGWTALGITDAQVDQIESLTK